MSLKRTARLAGILYFVTCIPAPFALIYVPSALIVREDAAETARRVLTSETMFRLGIVCELLTAVGSSSSFSPFGVSSVAWTANSRPSW